MDLIYDYTTVYNHIGAILFGYLFTRGFRRDRIDPGAFVFAVLFLYNVWMIRNFVPPFTKK